VFGPNSSCKRNQIVLSIVPMALSLSLPLLRLLLMVAGGGWHKEHIVEVSRSESFGR
jgi:hypothetical protein